ncbi:MAG: GIY-YIG nuclease family protein [Coriobacteriaceae bacterium]|nr:GIY-YIG nuclease family protein [Coriobacteriaceae bacterium]
MGKGQIYVLSNPALEGFVKIGYASDGNLDSRLKNLNTAVPYRFRVCALYETDTDAPSDKIIHALIDAIDPELHVNAIDENGRPYTSEFYKMSPEDACSLLKHIAKVSGTEARLTIKEASQEEQQEEADAEGAREQLRNRRSNLRFSLIGLRAGDLVQFKNDPTKSAVVCDDAHVTYEGEKYSLSKLAQKLLDTDRPLQGPAYFTYDDELLTDRRLRMEQEAAHEVSQTPNKEQC